jgi:hypothetical protein
MKELLNFKFSHYLDNPEEEVRLHSSQSISQALVTSVVEPEPEPEPEP